MGISHGYKHLITPSWLAVWSFACWDMCHCIVCYLLFWIWGMLVKLYTSGLIFQPQRCSWPNTSSCLSSTNNFPECIDITIGQGIDLFEIIYACRFYNLWISLQEGKKAWQTVLLRGAIVSGGPGTLQHPMAGGGMCTANPQMHSALGREQARHLSRSQPSLITTLRVMIRLPPCSASSCRKSEWLRVRSSLSCWSQLWLWFTRASNCAK